MMEKNKPISECEVDAIRHPGIISKIDEKLYYVNIVVHSACSECHSKGLCNISEIRNQVVEIPRNISRQYKQGDKVNIVMDRSLGTHAVVLSYLIPFIILISALLITAKLTDNQGVAGLISIGILVPYFFLLYKFKKILRKKFVFRITPDSGEN
jgi:sigma-E factor negative regulatory protein RseC